MQFLQPDTLGEAITALADDPYESKIIAGGTAVVLMLQQKLIAPQTLVSLGRIPDLRAIRLAEDGLRRLAGEDRPWSPGASRVEAVEADAVAWLAARPPGSVDVVFLDAVKEEYPEYWEIARPLVVVGGLVLADNVLGGQWWIGDEGHARAKAMDRFNRMVAEDEDFEAVAVPLRSGVLVGRRTK